MHRWPGNAKKQPTTFGQFSRSELMSRVRSTGNLTTEVRLAQFLKKSRITGWRRHVLLPGKPDFVWRVAKLVVFVDGCFWHGHDCGRNLMPKRHAKLWLEKIEGNRNRDRHLTRVLRRDGWKVIRIWECLLAKYPRRAISRIRSGARHRGTGISEKACPGIGRKMIRLVLRGLRVSDFPTV